jgi:hypothetical protein
MFIMITMKAVMTIFSKANLHFGDLDPLRDLEAFHTLLAACKSEHRRGNLSHTTRNYGGLSAVSESDFIVVNIETESGYPRRILTRHLKIKTSRCGRKFQRTRGSCALRSSAGWRRRST